MSSRETIQKKYLLRQSLSRDLLFLSCVPTQRGLLKEKSFIWGREYKVLQDTSTSLEWLPLLSWLRKEKCSDDWVENTKQRAPLGSKADGYCSGYSHTRWLTKPHQPFNFVSRCFPLKFSLLASFLGFQLHLLSPLLPPVTATSFFMLLNWFVVKWPFTSWLPLDPDELFTRSHLLCCMLYYQTTEAKFLHRLPCWHLPVMYSSCLQLYCQGIHPHIWQFAN